SGKLPLDRRCGGGDGDPARTAAARGAALQLGGFPARPTREQRGSIMTGSNVAGKRPSFNIGIEEEYQTIDPETRDLRSHIQAEIVQKGKTLLADRGKPEMH